MAANEFSETPTSPLPEQLRYKPNVLARFFAWALVTTLCLLPPAVREALGRGIGRLVHDLGIRRKVTLENLRHAFPEKTEEERRSIAKGAYESVALAALESLTSSRILAREPLGEMVMPPDGKAEEVRALLRQGKGVIMATAHMGSWELFGAMMLKEGFPMHAVVRPLKGALNRKITLSRVEAGIKLIPPKGAVAGICQALREGALVAILTDQAISAEKGIFVPFFGRPVSTAPALALAAQRTGAPVYLMVSTRRGGRIHLHVEGPLRAPAGLDPKAETVALTAEVAGAIERFIRRTPEQWLWLHRRWKVTPPAAASETPGASTARA